MDYVNPWHRKWHRNSILETIRSLFSSGADISYNALARRNQALVSAANYHFGSYRRAVMMAGLDYAAIAKKPKWTSAKVIDLVRRARQSGEALNWRAISHRRDDLRRAAAAAVKKRLFGAWDDALFASGTRPDEVRRYRRWNPDDVLIELKRRSDMGLPLNSASIQKQVPGLHGAAVRHFKSYDRALSAAKINPDAIRQRRSWTAGAVVKELKRMNREPGGVSRVMLRRENPSLLRAMRQQFGDFSEACARAGVRPRIRPEVQGLLFVDLKPAPEHPPLSIEHRRIASRPPRVSRPIGSTPTDTAPLFALFADGAGAVSASTV